MKKALKIMIPLLLALLIAGGAAWYLLLYRPSLTADYYIARAQSAAAEGRYDRAVDYYETAEELDAGNVEILRALAETYRLSGNYTKAEYTLVRAISLFPDDVSLYVALSHVYVEQDKLLDAEQMLSRAANDQVRAQLAELRPDAPVLTPESGYYNDYIEVSVSYTGGTVYLMTGEEYPTLSSPYTGPITLEKGETAITALVVDANGLVSPLTTAGYTIGEVDEEVIFTDAAIDSTVRAILGKSPTDTIMSSELWTITELTIPENAATLDDLIWFERLESLSTDILRGIDFSPISQLSSLRTLSLPGCSIDAVELEAFGTMTNLTSLNLSDCGLSSAAALSNLTNLETLILANNSIGNLSALEGLTKLKKLDLTRNAVTSLAVLVDLPTLEWLGLAHNPIDTLTPASGCKNMRWLDVTGCGISDLNPVGNMADLNELYASSNEISDISVLSGCPALVKLDLSDNLISDVSVLSGLTALTQANFNYNVITALPVMPAESPLFDLSVSHNKLTDVSGLAEMIYLNFLNIDYNEVQDIVVLSECRNLIEVNAFDNPIPEVQPLLDRGIIVNYDPSYIETYVPEEDSENDTEE